MNKFIYITIILSASFYFQSCKEQFENTQQVSKGSSVNQIDSVLELEKLKDTIHKQKIWEVEKANYAFTVEVIDASEFNSLKNQLQRLVSETKKITDYPTVKKMLKGVVEFNNDNYLPDENTSGIGLKKIYFQDGTIENAPPDDITFVAYYPDDEFILFQTANYLEVGYNLKNGDPITATGNPNYRFVASDSQFRVSGYTDSNDCLSYSLQQRNNDTFETVIPLSDAFESNENYRFCQIKSAFWSKDNTSLFIEEAYFEEPPNYYRIVISKSNELLDFVPDGYRIIHTIYGDLNNDNTKDCILILKGTDKTKIVRESNNEDKELDLNRRGIIILLKNENQYQLALENLDCFISDENNDGDYIAPKLNISIDKGKLGLNYANGRYGYWTYTFKYQNSDFELITYNESDNNSSIAYIVTNINFLNSIKIREVTSKGNPEEYENDGTYQDSKTKIKMDSLIRLSDIKDFEELRETIYSIKSN